MTLKLWRNGFSIDDGPLREFSDESNTEFLDAVKRGWGISYVYNMHAFMLTYTINYTWQ